MYSRYNKDYPMILLNENSICTFAKWNGMCVEVQTNPEHTVTVHIQNVTEKQRKLFSLLMVEHHPYCSE